MSKMYMVRAGKNAKLINHFKEDNLVAIGWSELENLNRINNRKKIENLVNEKYPQLNEKQKEPIIKAVSNFKDIKIGDYVISYNKPEKKFFIGSINSQYQFSPDNIIEREYYPHIIKVHWIEDISRDLMKKETQINLKNNLQVFCLNCDAYNDILDLVGENSATPMKTEPKSKSRPFFAYGTFKHNQLKYYKIKDYVVHREECEIKGNLIIRDGLPYYRNDRNRFIKGELLYFGENSSKAYEMINSLTNERYYSWSKGFKKNDSNIISFNILEDNNPCSKSRYDDSKNEYDSKSDPLFIDGINMIEDFIKASHSKDESLEKRLIQLQMNYLLLWIIIERFEELKYPPATKNKRHDEYLVKDEKFIQATNNQFNNNRAVYNTRSFYENQMDDENLYSSIRYFRTLRNNITHRGKTRNDDYIFLMKDLKLLLSIFKDFFELSF